MNLEILFSLLGAATSLAIGGGASVFIDLFKKLILKDNSKNFVNKKIVTYSDKITKLTENLNKSSREIDKVLKEIEIVALDHSKSVESLERQLSDLSQREKQVKDRIELLEKVPIEVVQQFESILQKGEKRSAWRDYVLFGLGVLVSTGIAIVLNIFNK